MIIQFNASTARAPLPADSHPSDLKSPNWRSDSGQPSPEPPTSGTEKIVRIDFLDINSPVELTLSADYIEKIRAKQFKGRGFLGLSIDESFGPAGNRIDLTNAEATAAKIIPFPVPLKEGTVPDAV